MPPSEKVKPAVRVRTGCLTCRKRRRKCDESKPECRNCQGRNLKCRYGVQLTFLKSNELRLEPDHAKELRKSGPVTYQKLRFVDIGDETSPADFSSPALLDTPSEIDDQISPPVSSSLRPENTVSFLRISESEDAIRTDDFSATQIVERDLFVNEYRHLSLPNEVIREKTPVGPPLPLDHDSRTSERLLDPVLRQVKPSELRYNYDSLAERPLALSDTPNSGGTNASGATPFLTETKNHTLKFFIDEVLPWLDASSTDQTWGLHLLSSSLRYNPLLYSILAFSTQQRALARKSNAKIESSDFAKHALESLGPDLYSRREEAVATRFLLKMHRVFDEPLREWHHLLRDDLELLQALGIHGFSSGMPGTISWILLRLDLAASISNKEPPQTLLEHWHPLLSGNLSLQEIYHARTSALEWTQYAILLCAKTTKLCFSNHTFLQNSTTDTSDWINLWNEVQSWHDLMPSDMKPFMNAPIGAIRDIWPSAFPSIIHTSRIAMFGCLVHHTTTILLLNARPRTVKWSSRMRSATWQAVQICGLSLSNDISWSQDPLVFAALLQAGYLLSYDMQQVELMKHIHRLVDMTGWDWKDSIDNLVQYWQSANIE